MSRDPAGAVIVSAFQRIECFCRTRIFSSPQRCQAAFVLGLLILASTVFAGQSAEALREKATSSGARVFTLRKAIETAFQRNPAILTARRRFGAPKACRSRCSRRP